MLMYVPARQQAGALPPHSCPPMWVTNGCGNRALVGGRKQRRQQVAGLHLSAHSMRRTFTNVCLKLAVEMWKVELLTSHVPTTTTLVHYTDTKDLRDTCAGEIQHVVVGSSLRRWPQSGRQMRQPHTEPSRQGCAYDVLTLG